MSVYRWCHLLLFAVVLQGTPNAFAQQIPPTADPGQISKYLEEDKGSVLDSTTDEPIPSTGRPVFRSAMPEGAAETIFTLKGIDIRGSTVYTQEELEEFYFPLIEQEISVADLYAVADAITKQYREDGYILARAGIPAQEINGRPIIQVVEGYVAKVVFADDAYQRGIVAEMTEKTETMRPLHMPTLEHMLLALNSDPSLSVTIVMNPLPEEGALQGAVEMGVTVERKRFEAAARLDNEGSRFIGPWQQMVEAGINDTAVSYDKLSVRGLATPFNSELRYGSATYSLPLDAFGTTLSADISFAHSEPGDRLEQFDVESDSERFSLTLDHPFLWQRDRLFATSASINFKDLQTNVLGSELSHDRILSVEAGIRGQYADDWDGVSFGNLSLSQGVNALGVRKTGSVNLSRAAGRSDFTKMEGTLSRSQRITDSLSAVVSAYGQYAFSQLLSAEQCSYGGMVYGRAYDPSEITGDSCANASAELRHQGWEIDEISSHISPFIYYDIGKTWTATAQESGASAGSGVRVAMAEALNLQLTIAFPLTREQSNPLNGNGTNPRYGMLLIWQY